MHPNQTFLIFLTCPFSNDLLTYAPPRWKLQAPYACGMTKWITKWKVQKDGGGVPGLLLQLPSTQVARKKMHVAHAIQSLL